MGRAFSNQSSAVVIHDGGGVESPPSPFGIEVALRQDWFHCEACGSPGVSIPTALTDASVVSCASCGLNLGSWAEYRRQVDQALTAEQTRRARRLIVADPIGSGGL